MKKIALAGFTAMLTLSASSAFAGEGKPHDQIMPIPENATQAQKRYMPTFSWEQGCKPAVAVDQAGNWNMGLRNSGSEGGQCRHQEGQVYVRDWCNAENVCAYMYSVYFPKDRGYIFGIGGHRHDWEEVVVWVESNGNVRGVAYSQHGDYEKREVGTRNPPPMHGTHAKVQYGRNGGTHSFETTNKVGESRPLIQWDALSRDAQRAIDRNWESAHPTVGRRFMEKIRESRIGQVSGL